MLTARRAKTPDDPALRDVRAGVTTAPDEAQAEAEPINFIVRVTSRFYFNMISTAFSISSS